MSFITFQKTFDVIEEVERNGLPQGCIFEKLKEIKNDVIIDKKLSKLCAQSLESSFQEQGYDYERRDCFF